jgi:hypothetical protein
MIILELGGQLAAPGFDVGTAGRPALIQPGIDADDLPDWPLAWVDGGSFGEPHSQAVAEVLLERGVVGLRGGNVGLEQHTAVDGQPPSVEGLYLVRHRNVGVQIRVAGPTVAMGERGRDQTSNIDLPDPLRPGPGKQGMLLNELQRIVDRGLMGPFDHSRHRRIGDRPQGRNRLHRRER